MKTKTKQITKQHNPKKPKDQPKKPITNQEGDPLIEHLNDFVTSINNTYTSKPIYTGGRIIVMGKSIYSSCNMKICIVKHNVHASEIHGDGSIVEGRISGHEWIAHNNQEIVNFCVCPQEKYIATFTQNFLLRLMRIDTKKILFTMKISGAFANDMAFSADGRYLACGFGNQVQIFTTETLKRTHTYYPSGNSNKFVITKLKWHPNPQVLQLITCDLQRNIAVFDYILNKVICTSEANQGGSDFCISQDGKNLYSINNQQIRFYELKNLQLKYRIPTEQYMQSIFVMDGIIYFGGEGTELLSIDSKKPELQMKQHKGCTDNGISKLMGIIYGNHTSFLFVLSFEQNITILKLSANNTLKHQGIIVGYNDEIIDIKTSKNEEQHQKYFVMVTNSNNVKVMNASTHKLEYLIVGHTNTVLCADYWHPYIATGGKDNQLKLWQINQEQHRVQLLGNYHGHSADIISLCILPKNHQITTISDDHTLKLWPMISPSLQQTNSVIQIRSSLHTVPAHSKSINNVKVCPKEEYIATCSQDKSIKIWDINLNLVMELSGHRKGVWDIAFHEREKLLVSVGGEGMMKGWSLLTGENVWSMGQGPAIIRCSWIYYNQVITGSADGIIKIWDIRKMTSLTYDKHQGKIWALDVNKNKNKKARIYSGATDSVYHVWDDNTSDMKQSIMHRNQLQEQQKINYLQYMADNNYIEAAVVAFRGGYTKLFLNVLQKIYCPFNPQLSIQFTQTQQLIIPQQQQNSSTQTETDLTELIKKLKQINLTNLLNTLQTMNSTVKHYKIANKILQVLLSIMSVEEFVEVNRSFVGNGEGDEGEGEVGGERKSGFQKWLENMIANTGKHANRINKYVKGTYWIEHLKKIDNPYIY